MPDKKIKIRSASTSDCEDILAWRSDPISRSMFFDGCIPSIEQHRLWFEGSLTNVNCKLFIGEIDGSKIGVCRFDIDAKESSAEVSINMNPTRRGSGLGKKFLAASVGYYLKDNKHDLLARIKMDNIASFRIFEAIGFKTISKDLDRATLKRKHNEFFFKKIVEEDSELLFELLKKRIHSISHKQLPSKEEHFYFVKTNPYRYWALVYSDAQPVGTVYLQTDNSIGLNLLQPSPFAVSEILRHIRDNFEPATEIKSRVPSYFYVNVSHENNSLKEILLQLEAMPIQISYKI